MFIFIKIDLALNNLQMLICHKTQKSKQTNPLMYITFTKTFYGKDQCPRLWGMWSTPSLPLFPGPP